MQLFAEVLTQQGYETQSALSGQGALTTTIATSFPALIFLDVMLPRLVQMLDFLCGDSHGCPTSNHDYRRSAGGMEFTPQPTMPYSSPVQSELKPHCD